MHYYLQLISQHILSIAFAGKTKDGVFQTSVLCRHMHPESCGIAALAWYFFARDKFADDPFLRAILNTQFDVNDEGESTEKDAWFGIPVFPGIYYRIHVEGF